MDVIKKLIPLNNSVITTIDKYEHDVTENGLLVYTAGTVKPYQKVVAIGPMVRDINVGDIVEINPKAYIKKRYDNSIREDMGADNPTESICIPQVNIDGTDYFAIYSNDVKWIVEIEEVADLPTNKIIMPKKPEIIL